MLSPAITRGNSESSSRLMANDVLEANKAGSLWLSPGLLEQFQQMSQTGKGKLMLSDQEAIQLGVSRIALDPRLVPVLSTLAKSSMANQQPRSQTDAGFSNSAIHRLVGGGMHRLGRAVDISRHAGFRINVFQEEEALKGVLSIIKTLPPGYFALGLSRLPTDTSSNPEQAWKHIKEKSRFKVCLKNAYPSIRDSRREKSCCSQGH